jgi:hypothetical protein
MAWNPTLSLSAAAAVLVAALAPFSISTAAVAAPSEPASTQTSTIEIAEGTISTDRLTASVPVTYVCEAGTTQTITIDFAGGFNNGSGSKVVECTGAEATDSVDVKAVMGFFAARTYAFAWMTDGTKLMRVIDLHY